MRGFFALAAAAMMAFAPVSPAFAAKVSKSEITESLSSQGYRVEDWGPRTVGVTVGNYLIRVDIVGADGDITYLTILDELDGSGISHSVLNQFNNDIRFGRAYIDEDDFVVLQMDRNSAGGASIENFESDFEVFLVLISEFLKHLEAQAIA